MNKVIVFWIEDNPKSCADFDEDDRGFLNSEFFDFYIFQSIEEIKEYLQMVSKVLSTNKKKSLLLKAEYAIPDLIVYDYLLSEAIYSKTRPGALAYENEQWELEILKDYNISLNFQKDYPDLFSKEDLIFTQKENGEWNYGPLKSELGLTENQPSDEFGLFAGLTILRYFKDHPNVAIPSTTNKKNVESLNINARFFEWINDYDQKDPLSLIRDVGNEIDERDIKKIGEKIIPFGLPLLRNQILQKSKAGKITIDLETLESIIKEIEQNGGNLNIDQFSLSYKTEFGIKNISIGALFSDITEDEKVELDSDLGLSELKEKLKSITEDMKSQTNEVKKRSLKLYADSLKKKIKRYNNFDSIENRKVLYIINYIFKLQESHLGDKQTLNDVLYISDYIFDKYANLLLPRIKLSDYYTRHNELVKVENDEFSELKALFNVDVDNVILNSECIDQFEEHFDKETIRLSILHLLTRAEINLKKNNSGSDAMKLHLNEEDMYYILNPVINVGAKLGLTLPMHANIINGQTDLRKKAVNLWGTKLGRLIHRKIDKGDPIQQRPAYMISNWITNREKSVLKSMFLDFEAYFPQWLKY